MDITSNVKSLPLPPGDFGLPIIGKIKIFTEQSINNLEFIDQNYGEIYKAKILGQKFIVMQGYESVKFVLTYENKFFTNTTLPTGKIIFGQTHVGALTGDKHKERRKLLTKALKGNVLEEYINTIDLISQSYLEKWINYDYIDLYSEFNNFCLDLLLKLLVGIESSSTSDIGNDLKYMAKGLFTIPLPLPQTKFTYALEGKKKIFSKLDEIISNRQQSNNFGSDILGILLTVEKQIENQLSFLEYKEQIINLLFLGRMEIASALTSFLMLVAQHPNILELLQMEQQKLDKSEPLSLAKLKKMTYLEQVTKEVLRQAPPVSAGLRKVVKDCSFQGWRIPKGWNLIYLISPVLQDPEIYKEPQTFNPDRFNSSNAEDKKKPLCYIPFGGGVRECIGKEVTYTVIKIFISNLLNSYTWEFKQNQDLTINQIPISRPASKVETCFSKR
jgi:cytochrome P450